MAVGDSFFIFSSRARLVPATPRPVVTSRATTKRAAEMVDWERLNLFIHKRIPILSWLPKYNFKRDFKYDLLTGFTVAVMLIPQEMSSAAMMGVPPQYGLYSAALSPLLYPLFGSSKCLAVANSSESALFIGVLLKSDKIKTLEERIATGILITFFMGLIMLVVALVHQGGAVSYFSRTSMNGYVTGTGVLLLISQLPGWFGVTIKSKATLTIFTLIKFCEELPNTNKYSFVLGLGCIILLLIAKKVKIQLQAAAAIYNARAKVSSQGDGMGTPSHMTDADYHEHTDHDVIDVQLHTTDNVNRDPAVVVPVDGNAVTSGAPSVQTPPSPPTPATVVVPTPKTALQRYFVNRPRATMACVFLCDAGALISCVIGICVGSVLGKDKIRITGHIPPGLPSPIFPPSALGGLIPWSNLQLVIIDSIIVTVIIFISSFAAGQRIAVRDGYNTSPNQELIGLGIANFVGSFFQTFPTSGGMGRTVVNSSAKSPLASMITAIIVIITLLALTKQLYYLPQSPLAAIIIVAVLSLIDTTEPRWLFKVRRTELYVWLVSFFATILVGLIYGLLIAIIASLLAIMARSKKPRVYAMGQLPDGTYADAEATGSQAKELMDIVIVRMDHAMYFGNASHFIHGIQHKLESAKVRGHVHGIVIDGSRMNDIDAPAIHTIKEFYDQVRKKDIELTFANLLLETAQSLSISGIWPMKPGEATERQLTGSVEAAVAFLRRQYQGTHPTSS